MKSRKVSSLNPVVKNILFALAVAVFGFILLNVAFLLDFLYQTLLDKILGLFISVDVNMRLYWYPPIKHLSYLALLWVGGWYIFRSKLHMLLKAIYMTVPLAFSLATIGMFLYQWPIAAYVVGASFSLGVLYYLYRTKQPWLYYYTLVLVSLTMLMITIFGVEI